MSILIRSGTAFFNHYLAVINLWLCECHSCIAGSFHLCESVNDEVWLNETIRNKVLSQNFSFFFQTAIKSFKQKNKKKKNLQLW